MENLTGELDEFPGEHTVMPSAVPVNPQLGKLPMLSLVNTSKLSFVVPPLYLVEHDVGPGAEKWFGRHRAHLVWYEF